MTATSVTTTFTPLHDRILLRRVEEGETVRGGIIIPDSKDNNPSRSRLQHAPNQLAWIGLGLRPICPTGMICDENRDPIRVPVGAVSLFLRVVCSQSPASQHGDLRHSRAAAHVP